MSLPVVYSLRPQNTVTEIIFPWWGRLHHNIKMPFVHQRKRQIGHLLGWTFAFSYGIIIPITRRFPSLHVQACVSVLPGHYIQSHGWIRIEIYKHGFSLTIITVCIALRSGGWQRLTNTLGKFCPGVFFFLALFLYAHWKPGSSIILHFVGHYSMFTDCEHSNYL